jgi:hypothetical protein
MKASVNGGVAPLILNCGSRSIGSGRFTPGKRSPVQETSWAPIAIRTVFENRRVA